MKDDNLFCDFHGDGIECAHGGCVNCCPQCNGGWVLGARCEHCETINEVDTVSPEGPYLGELINCSKCARQFQVPAALEKMRLSDQANPAPAERACRACGTVSLLAELDPITGACPNCGRVGEAWERWQRSAERMGTAIPADMTERAAQAQQDLDRLDALRYAVAFGSPAEPAKSVVCSVPQPMVYLLRITCRACGEIHDIKFTIQADVDSDHWSDKTVDLLEKATGSGNRSDQAGTVTFDPDGMVSNG